MGTGTVKFLWIINWALISESNAIFIHWTRLQKKTKHKNQKRSRKFYTKKISPMKQSVAHCMCEVSQLLELVTSPIAISFQGHLGVGVTPQSSCPHSAGSGSHQLSYTDQRSPRTPCSPSAPSPETCWPLH